MNVSDVVALAACSVIVAAEIVLAWVAGWRAGYWRRVKEEREARGI